MMDVERRARRSDDPAQALGLFLSAARARLGGHALAVGTCDGHLVAGSGEGALLVAVLGAKAVTGEENANEGRVAVTRIQLGARRYVVTSFGASLSSDVTEGVRRILS